MAALLAATGFNTALAQDDVVTPTAPREGAASAPSGAPAAGASPSDLGWYIGVKLGVGDPAVSRRESGGLLTSRISGPWPVELASLELGVKLAPRWRLGAELASRAQVHVPWWTGSEEISNLDAIATYFPTEHGLFVRGGAGVAARFDHLWRHVPASERIGLDLRAGGGYEWSVWKGLTVKAGLDTTRQWYRLSDGFAAMSSYTTLYAGVGWN